MIRNSLAIRIGMGLAAAAAIAVLKAPPAAAGTFFFSTGDPDGKMATASRPGVPGGAIEIESADDFILPSATQINSATFTGLIPSGATVENVDVEIYRVFPKDSMFPPNGAVPTRVNSPSDVAFEERDASVPGQLSFTTTPIKPSFTAANSVLNDIKLPSVPPGGEGPVTGEEVQFNADFTTPFDLPADHYFFVPQVQLNDGNFFWLSAPRPIVPPGTPLALDLQEWIRNADLEPNWLRVGTDIVGGTTPPTFNATFSLTGVTVPEPSTVWLLTPALVGLAGMRWIVRRRPPAVAPEQRSIPA